MNSFEPFVIIGGGIACGLYLSWLIRKKMANFRKNAVTFILFSLVNIIILGISEKTQSLIALTYPILIVSFAFLINFLILTWKKPNLKKVLTLKKGVRINYGKDTDMFKKVIIDISAVGAFFGIVMLIYFDILGIIVAVVVLLK